MTTSQILLTMLSHRYEPIGFYELTAGVVAAVGVGASCGWYRSHPLEDYWQRGVIAILSGVGALLVGFAVAIVEGLTGVRGMIVWLVLNISGGILGTRWAIRGMGEEGRGTDMA